VNERLLCGRIRIVADDNYLLGSLRKSQSDLFTDTA
jgi:hypothetical protein